MGTTGSIYYRFVYKNKDGSFGKGGLVGRKIMPIMKKDGMLLTDSRGKILGRIRMTIIIEKETLKDAGILYGFVGSGPEENKGWVSA